MTQWFPPEPAPVGVMLDELAQDVSAAGWRVRVVTGFPNHPQGKLYPGFKRRLFSREKRNGFDLIRVWTIFSKHRTVFHRGLTFLTFAAASFFAVVFLPRAQVIFAVFQPILLAIPLVLVSWLKGSKLILNVQDLHPDAAAEAGLIQNPLLLRFLRWVERFGYRKADGLSVICEGFRRHTIDRGASPERARVMPNWIDLTEIRPQGRETRLRQELGLTKDDFVVLYAGTLGWVSGAEILVDTAALLSEEPGVKFVVAGEGPVKHRLESKARERGLDQVRFLPFQPRERLAELQSTADVSVVTLLPGRGRWSVPSKVLGFLAAGRPVVASVDADSETALFLKRSGGGVIALPGNPSALAEAIRALWNDPERRDRLGQRGRSYLETHLGRDRVTAMYREFFEEMACRP